VWLWGGTVGGAAELRRQSVTRLLLRVAGETFAVFTARHLHNSAETEKVTMEIADGTSTYPEHINLHFANDKRGIKKSSLILHHGF